MFSRQQKEEIAEKIEKILLEYNHPEMPKENPEFLLKVKGREIWSWADIEPNHHYDNKEPGVNLHNEIVAEVMRTNNTK